MATATSPSGLDIARTASPPVPDTVSTTSRPPVPDIVSTISQPPVSDTVYTILPLAQDITTASTVTTASITASASASQVPRIAKLTVSSGYIVGQYERAIESHRLHAEMHGYAWHVLREEIMDGAWNKLPLLMSVALNEMRKPVEDRIQWLFFFDADSILLNPHIPLEIFLPPPSHSHINLLIAKDWNGINAGTFFLRVCPAAIELLARIMAYVPMHPGVDLTWAEQTALNNILGEDEAVRKATQYVPKIWFNAYMIDNEDDLRGRLMVHFAGPGIKWKMWKWLERAGYTPNALALSSDPALSVPSAASEIQSFPPPLELSYQFSTTTASYWQPTLPFSPYPLEIRAFWSAVRRASAIVRGLDKQNGDIHDNVQNSGSKVLEVAAKQKYEALKKAIIESGETKDLDKAATEADEANEKWVGTMKDDDMIPIDQPLLPKKIVTEDAASMDENQREKLLQEYKEKIEEYRKLMQDQQDGLVGGGPTMTSQANPSSSPTTQQTASTEAHPMPTDSSTSSASALEIESTQVAQATATATSEAASTATSETASSEASEPVTTTASETTSTTTTSETTSTTTTSETTPTPMSDATDSELLDGEA